MLAYNISSSPFLSRKYRHWASKCLPREKINLLLLFLPKEIQFPFEEKKIDLFHQKIGFNQYLLSFPRLHLIGLPPKQKLGNVAFPKAPSVDPQILLSQMGSMQPHLAGPLWCRWVRNLSPNGKDKTAAPTISLEAGWKEGKRQKDSKPTVWDVYSKVPLRGSVVHLARCSSH